MNRLHFYKPFLILHTILLAVGCGKSYESRVDDYLSVLAEEERCDTTVSYPAGVSLLGVATFEKRSIDVITENIVVIGNPNTNSTKLKNMSLGDPLPIPLPIRYAEISVYDVNNKKIQCGVTDQLGNYKAVDLISPLKIPNKKGTYKLRVSSRSYYVYNADPADFSYISVKQDKYRNELHSLISEFNLTGNTTVTVNLNAKARQTDSINIEAGAFNVMNSIQVAYDYVKMNTGTVNTKCLATKLNVFWKAGFNPMQYQSPEADPQTLGNTSYYLPLTKELYISGGQIGDLSLSNTDHFDDFAIIHELGHFVEDHCGQWVSTGGNHTLTSRIEPRLAWSEGWANYFSAHVIQSKIADLDYTLSNKLSVLSENNPTNFGWTYFFNSYGFSDSVQNIGNGDGLVIDFKKSGSDPGAYIATSYTGQEYDKVVPLTYPGEGHVREGAISRGFFKLTNSCGTYCATTPTTFENIWKSFDKITGSGSANTPFNGSDKVLEILKTTAGSWTSGLTSRNTVIESEALHLKSNGSFGSSPLQWPGYGNNLITGSTCNLSIQPRSDSTINRSSSDQRYSNHFYNIDFGLLAGLNSITVTFTKQTGSNTDHDLILFKSGYYFNDDYTCILLNGSCSSFVPNRNSTNEDVFVMNRLPSTTTSSTYSKTIYLNGINTAEKYLLDIRSWTAGLTISGLTEYSYSINSNLGGLCPQ